MQQWRIQGGRAFGGCSPLPLSNKSSTYINIDVAHGIGDTALIHFKISMRLLIFIEVRPIIWDEVPTMVEIAIF
jgi:hypothetical protein